MIFASYVKSSKWYWMWWNFWSANII